jgi:dihydrofolate reductase
MGKLTWSINVTLDGCCDHRGVVADAELHRYATAVLDDAKCLLFGRVSYELLESYWPSVARGEVPDAENTLIAFACRLDAKPKYVASRTLNAVRWNALLLKGDLAEAVGRLKHEHSDVLVFGSPGLGSWLTRMDLVDEYHFLIQPIVAGRGLRLLDGASRRNFRLLEARSFSSGVMLARHGRV